MLASLHKELDDRSLQIANLEAIIEQKDSEVISVKAKESDALERVAELETKLGNKQAQLLTAEKEHQAKIRDIEFLSQEQKALQKQVKALKSEKLAVDAKVKDLDSKIAEKDNSLNVEAARKIKLQEELKVAKNNIVIFEREKAILEKANAAVERTSEIYKKELQALRLQSDKEAFKTKIIKNAPVSNWLYSLATRVHLLAESQALKSKLVKGWRRDYASAEEFYRTKNSDVVNKDWIQHILSDGFIENRLKGKNTPQVVKELQAKLESLNESKKGSQ